MAEAIEEEKKTEDETPKREPAKRRTTTRKKSATKKKAERPLEFVKSKRKTSVARASATSGTGIIRINGFDINTYEPIDLRRLMLEPLHVSKETHDTASKMDIKVNVRGGGISSQAQAVRSAIAKSIVAVSGSSEIKNAYVHYDRYMLIDDVRRVEPKKFKGPKARARVQKSYR
jgi:small subunit ribosomal protein S9